MLHQIGLTNNGLKRLPFFFDLGLKRNLLVSLTSNTESQVTTITSTIYNYFIIPPPTGSIVTLTDSNSPESIFTNITSSTLNTGYTITFVTTQNTIETSEVYIPPSTVVVIKKVSAVILSVSTSTSTSSNLPKSKSGSRRNNDNDILFIPGILFFLKETATDDNNFNGLSASLLPIISSFTSSLATNFQLPLFLFVAVDAVVQDAVNAVVDDILFQLPLFLFVAVDAVVQDAVNAVVDDILVRYIVEITVSVVDC
ncbi:hypothetical protein Glove_199g35 [Diversispora epigaea]|uniref:Uncharacterized protein n=1 Tax=Diversispora epigaea TaxID=1348612 RepID=A0A397IJS4_9GLOM|nr:hypothetical protein Glove_199g35 [Diversispora epigaea]